jgi:tetratricopeptide (TPR) repeat protein
MLKEAEGSFRKAINIEPDYADALYGLGKVCQKHAETDGSQKLEQHVCEVKNRIETLYEQDRIEEARQISKKLIELSPDDAENQNDYAVLCYELDKIEEAREAINNAQKLAPEDENVRANYQMIYSDNWKDWKGEIDL